MQILRIAILEMLRQKKTLPFYPEEVVRQMYPEDWSHFIPDILMEMKQMQEEHLISLEENNIEIVKDNYPTILTKISPVKK